jgi:membrane protease YdiL (CAAX protease family)
MAPNRSQPWNPHRSWADPLITCLLLGILVLAGFPSRRRVLAPRPAQARVSFQGRVLDAALGAAKDPALTALVRGWQPDRTLAALAPGRRTPWDQAVLAVHAAEAGNPAVGATLIRAAPGPEGEAFRQAWTWCYQGQGGPPPPSALPGLRAALGDGYAARVLEARLRARAGGDPGPLLAQARAWALAKVAIWSAAGAAAALLALAGLAFALYLGARSLPPRPLPRYGMSGRAVLIVLLGWFFALLAAPVLVGLVVRALPFLRPLLLPLVYGCHALAGVWLLCRAEGIGPADLVRRVAPGRHGAALATGLGFFALAFTGVITVALVLGPLLSHGEPPQKELLEFLARFQGTWTVAVLFLTVAVLAPAFEELMFRGFLLPWLGERLTPRLGERSARLAAVGLSGLGFGLMHMQPLGLPTLTTLGIILGLAFLRTGNLVTSILVHGLWNGGVFILLRTVF